MRFSKDMTPEALATELEAMEARIKASEAANADLTTQLTRNHAERTGANESFAAYAMPKNMVDGTIAARGHSNGILLRGFDTDESGRPVPSRFDSEGPQAVAHTAGYLDDVAATDALQIEIQDYYAARQLIRMRQKTAGQELHTPLLDWKIRALIARTPEAIQKAFVDTNGVGGEWIPVDTFVGVERAAELLYQRMVPGLFPVFNCARNITIPTWLTMPVPYIFGVTGDDPAKVRSSDIGTSSVSTALKTIAARLQVSEDDLEESIVANTPSMLMEALAMALVTAEEDVIMNGDTTATHRDTALATWNPNGIYSATPGGTSIDHRRAWMGLRHRANTVSNTVDRSTFSYAIMIADRAALVGPKVPGNVALIGSELGLGKNVYSLDQFATAEKYGSPSNVTGNIGRYALGCDIVESRLMTDDLNATGIFDGATMTKSGLIYVIKNDFRRFVRYGIRVETVREPQSGLIHFVARQRMDFQSLHPTRKNVRYGYNIAIA